MQFLVLFLHLISLTFFPTKIKRKTEGSARQQHSTRICLSRYQSQRETEACNNDKCAQSTIHSPRLSELGVKQVIAAGSLDVITAILPWSHHQCLRLKLRQQPRCYNRAYVNNQSLLMRDCSAFVLRGCERVSVSVRESEPAWEWTHKEWSTNMKIGVHINYTSPINGIILL